jgi:nucleotide-binding universal stress UspA family protein
VSPAPGPIVCAVDFSVGARAAAAWAAELARARGARLRLVHVLPLPIPVMPVPELGLGSAVALAPSEPELRQHAEDALRRLAYELGVEPDVEVVFGVAATEIVRAARTSGAGTIVVGSHGRTGLAHALLGSVAERVLRSADRPVLVVPERRRRAQ